MRPERRLGSVAEVEAHLAMRPVFPKQQTSIRAARPATTDTPCAVVTACAKSWTQSCAAYGLSEMR